MTAKDMPTSGDQSDAAWECPDCEVGDPAYENAVRALAREVIALADADDNDHPDNVVTRDEHALRVLFEGRLAADVADAVAALREGR